jgi:ubiquinone/menaquinone biosynthesis C-methylase UbiE
MDKKDVNPETFERNHVQDVYNIIAPHFSATRITPWPMCHDFLKNAQDYSVIADIGCGNGKYMKVNDKAIMIGSDLSDGLIEICVKRDLNCIVADNLVLPFRSNSMDHAISIAVIHHFANVERRVKAVEEIVRIVKPGGRICIYVWAFEQLTKDGKQKYQEQDVFVPWELQATYQKGESNFEKDEKGKVVFKRYYHMFKSGEVEELVSHVKGIKILDCRLEKENWCIILEKL